MKVFRSILFLLLIFSKCFGHPTLPDDQDQFSSFCLLLTLQNSRKKRVSRHTNGNQEDDVQNHPDESSELKTTDDKDQEDNQNHPGYKIEIDEDISDETATNNNIEEDVKKTKKVRKLRKPRVRGICDNPSCQVKSAHRCSRCLQVAFCSTRCQAAHWAVHQEDCTPWRLRQRTVSTMD